MHDHERDPRLYAAAQSPETEPTTESGTGDSTTPDGTGGDGGTNGPPPVVG